MSAGVATAKNRKYGGWTKYQFPKYLIKMKQSKEVRTIREGLMRKLGRYCHISKNVVKTDLYHQFVQLFKLDREFAPIMINRLNLTPNDIGYIIGEDVDSNRVNFLVEEASILREKGGYVDMKDDQKQDLFASIPTKTTVMAQPPLERKEEPSPVVRPILPPKQPKPSEVPQGQPSPSIAPRQDDSIASELNFEEPKRKAEKEKKMDKKQRTLFDF